MLYGATISISPGDNALGSGVSHANHNVVLSIYPNQELCSYIIAHTNIGPDFELGRNMLTSLYISQVFICLIGGSQVHKSQVRRLTPFGSALYLTSFSLARNFN